MLSRDERYVLLRIGSDGRPVWAQPVSSLEDGRKQLAIKLASENRDGWRLFDCLGDKFIDLESRQCPPQHESGPRPKPRKRAGEQNPEAD